MNAHITTQLRCSLQSSIVGRASQALKDMPQVIRVGILSYRRHAYCRRQRPRYSTAPAVQLQDCNMLWTLEELEEGRLFTAGTWSVLFTSIES
jgi:hypothetical protein